MYIHGVEGQSECKVEARGVEGGKKGWSTLSGRLGGCFVGFVGLFGQLVDLFNDPTLLCAFESDKFPDLS